LYCSINKNVIEKWRRFISSYEWNVNCRVSFLHIVIVAKVLNQMQKQEQNNVYNLRILSYMALKFGLFGGFTLITQLQVDFSKT